MSADKLPNRKLELQYIYGYAMADKCGVNWRVLDLSTSDRFWIDRIAQLIY